MTPKHNRILGAVILVLGLVVSSYKTELGIPSFWTGALMGVGISTILLSNLLFQKKK